MRRPTDDQGPSLFDYWDRKLAAVAGPDVARIQQQNRALEHERQAGRTKHKSRSKILQGRVTLTDIGRLIQHRHNGQCDTEDGETYLRAALPCVVEEAGGFENEHCEARVREWARVATPLLTEPEIRATLSEARERNARGRLYWGPQDLGDLLALTKAEREALRITKARPQGMTPKTFAAYQRAQKTAAEKARRNAAGAKAREQSDAQTRPWEALGISRRTFYRKHKAMPPIGVGTNSCLAGTKYRIAPTGQCHEEIRPLQVPARQASPGRIVGAGGHSPRSEPRQLRQGNAVAPPLPMDRVSQPDMLAEWQPLAAVVSTYLGGMMPPELALAVRAAQRARMVTQETAARSIGISRPQLANALQGRFGLSQSAAANLVRWLEAA